MKAFHSIRLSFASYQLNKEVQRLKRRRGDLHFDRAKSIGLLFDPTEEADFELVKKFIKYIRDYKKQVKSIGFYNLKQVPSMQYSKLEYDFISQKELNWWYKPTEDFIPAFLEEEFDILINLSLKNHFPITYMAALSRAKVKIGPAGEGNEKFYDIMIDVGEEQQLKFYLKQLDHYLNLINRPHDTV